MRIIRVVPAMMIAATYEQEESCAARCGIHRTRAGVLL